jgi:hypothetical protein
MTTTEAKQAILDEMKAQDLTVTSEFVPLSRSRNAAEKRLTLNWRVTLKRGDRTILTTDYSAGCAYAPSYRQRMTADVDAAVRWECEHGKKAKEWLNGVFIGGAPIKPDACDVIYSLTLDSDVLDAGGFKEWAANLAYDTDSRKAEAIYRACLDIALKLRVGLGEGALERLRKACADY